MERATFFRFIRWMLLAGLTVPLSSCGSGVGLGPGLVGFTGGSPAAAIPLPPGSVVILLINKTAEAVSVTTLVTQANGNVSPSTISVGPGGFNAISTPCGVSSVQLESVSAGGTLNLDGTIDGGADIGNFIPRFFLASVNLRCGAVISVKVAPDDTDPDALPEAADNVEPDVIVEDFQ